MMPRDALVRRRGAALVAFTVVAALVFIVGNTANAAIVPTVPLGTSANYAVLGASTVTNTGNSVLDGSLGLWPGTSITGFPPGQVLLPGTTDVNNPAAQQAQTDLSAAYANAAGRPLDATTSADLANLTLPGGVYAAPGKSALSLTGQLILDGASDPSSVFIFQTATALTTAAGSTVTLINGAQQCNVFWQVGTSATLGASSVFAGNILALTSITVGNSVTVHGRALAGNGAVTLDNDAFTKPTCVQPAPTTATLPAETTTTQPVTTTTQLATTTTTQPATTTTQLATTTTTQPATTTTQLATTTTTQAATTTTQPAATTTTQPTTQPAATTTTQPTTQPATTSTATASAAPTTSTTAPGVTATTAPSTELPRTGSPIRTTLLLAVLALLLGAVAISVGRMPGRRDPALATPAGGRARQAV